jgi:hypothetical protein
MKIFFLFGNKLLKKILYKCAYLLECTLSVINVYLISH